MPESPTYLSPPTLLHQSFPVFPTAGSHSCSPSAPPSASASPPPAPRHPPSLSKPSYHSLSWRGGFEDALLKTDTPGCFCPSQTLGLSPGPRTWQPPFARTLFPAHLHNAAHLQSCSEGRPHSPSQECRPPLGSMEPHRGSWSVHRSGQRSPRRTYSWSPE